jgi:hypothetical protein
LNGGQNNAKSLVWPVTITIVTIFMLYRLWNLGVFHSLLGVGPKSIFTRPAAPADTSDDGFPTDEF